MNAVTPKELRRGDWLKKVHTARQAGRKGRPKTTFTLQLSEVGCVSASSCELASFETIAMAVCLSEVLGFSRIPSP